MATSYDIRCGLHNYDVFFHTDNMEHFKIMQSVARELFACGECRECVDIELMPVIHAKLNRASTANMMPEQPYPLYRCSNCGNEMFIKDTNIFHYCVNCGAKFDEECEQDG